MKTKKYIKNKNRGGTIPTSKTLKNHTNPVKEPQENNSAVKEPPETIFDPFVYNTCNVFYDDVLIHYKQDYTETLALQKDFSAFVPHPITETDIQNYQESLKFNAFHLSNKEDLQIDLPKIDIHLSDVKLFTMLPVFQDKMNEMLTTICKTNNNFEKFIKTNYSPFGIIRDTTHFMELRKDFNLFNKYTFLNKFYELLDILLHAKTDEEIKEKLLLIYDNDINAFINCCDYMTFLNNFGQQKNNNIKNIQPAEYKSYTFLHSEAQKKTHAYYSKMNGYTENLKKDVNQYLNEEIKLIKKYKKEFVDVIYNSSQKECKQIAEDIGMDMFSFTLLFYIHHRLQQPSLFIPSLGIALFQISKEKFISNLLKGKPYQKVIDKNIFDTFDYFDVYPKITDYQCKLESETNFAACGERGLFEFIKFICFHIVDNNGSASFVAPEGIFINKNIQDFINKHSTQIWDSKMEDGILFTAFNSLISGNNKISDIGYNYSNYNIQSPFFKKVLEKIVDLKEITSKRPDLLVEEILDNLDNGFILTNEKANIKLKILFGGRHVSVQYFKIRNYFNHINFKCINNITLKYLATQYKTIKLEIIDTGKVTNMNSLFLKTAFNQDISNWNTDNVTDMSNMFSGCNYFNQNIGGWNTENVTNMSSMFYGCNYFNQNIGGWNTENVTNMSNMFSGCKYFNQDIGWNTKKVTNMSDMFIYCENFNKNIGGWNTEKVTNMSNMFYGCTKFNQNIGGWNTELVTDMSNMFKYCEKFNQNINYNPKNGGWNTEKVTNMSNMFFGCKNFNQEIGGWNTQNVINMSNMFFDCKNFNQDIGWNTKNVTDMNRMFTNCEKFNQNIGGWNTEIVTNMSYMFSGCKYFNENIGAWNTKNVTNMSSMFSGCSSFNQNIGGWNTELVTDMSYMFSSCSSFNQDVGGWNTEKVTNMNKMFSGCKLFNQNINYNPKNGAWNTKNVTNMSDMFNNCISFNQDIGGWNTENVTNMGWMFYDCKNFNQDISAWKIKNGTNMNAMFKNSGVSKDIQHALIEKANGNNINGGKRKRFLFTNSQKKKPIRFHCKSKRRKREPKLRFLS